MIVLLLMIPMALILGFGFLAAFLYGVNAGQFDDLDTPAKRILFEEKKATMKGKK